MVLLLKSCGPTPVLEGGVPVGFGVPRFGFPVPGLIEFGVNPGLGEFPGMPKLLSG